MKRLQKIIIAAIACILTAGMVAVQEPSMVQASPQDCGSTQNNIE